MADIRVRAGWMGTLQRLLATVEALNPDTVTSGDIKSHLETADRVWQKLDTAHTNILATCADDAAVTVQQDALAPMEVCYTEIKSKLYNLKQASNVGPSRHQTSFKLPDMSLPTFDGKYEDWSAFEDLFNASIHRNPNLSGSQKLQYLKACVRGEASSLIKSFVITDANYVAAWKLLEDQYNNLREIIQSHVRRLLFQPSLKKESSVDLQAMLTTTLESIRSLQVLGRPTDKWDDIIAVLLVEKFDAETKAEWAKGLTGTHATTFDEVEKFIRRHIRTLHARGIVKPVNTSKAPVVTKTVKAYHTSISTCLLCEGSHQLHQCTKFKDMTPEQRVAAVKEARVCYNCIKAGHQVRECKSSSCRKCELKHHTLLHLDKGSKATRSNEVATSSQQQEKESAGKSIRIATTQLATHSSTLMKTAIVDVYDTENVKHSIRVFIDDGGEGSLIRLDLLRQLGVKEESCRVTITGVENTILATAAVKGTVRLHSQHCTEAVEIEVFAVKQITGILNKLTMTETRNMSAWSHLKGLQLADPEFYDGGQVGILLGGDVAPYILKGGIKMLDNSSPVAQDTIYGWVLSGKTGGAQQRSFSINSFSCEISSTLRKFWEFEEVPRSPALTPEEEMCEKHFLETHRRKPDGRYVVRLPFNEKKDHLGESRQQAFRRLRALERRFERQPQYKEAYIKFMREYEQLGHMRRVRDSAKKVKNSYYLPHHFVLKEESTTTKQRTVFDGSAKTTTGVSLNDALMVGPTVQPDLFTIVIQFRYDQIGMKADMKHMYRQFEVDEEDQPFQRILWRENDSDELIEYELTTVTYGTGSASYQATRCLKQLALDEKDSFPLASEALLKKTYVDDFVGTASSLSVGIDLVRQLIGIARSGGMEIRKWCSSNADVVATIPEELRETGAIMSFQDDGNIKALGIKWQPSTDQFLFTVTITTTAIPTKRFLLSEISKTFDPLGWLAPVTINAKLLLQKVWLAGCDWDSAVPDKLQDDWTSYVENLKQVENVRVPRCVISDVPKTVELHAFSDSSELAYVCALYLKCVYVSGSVSVELLTSRTKVAPLKCVSLPKLELCAAKLAAETVEVIQKSLPHQHQLHCWTDSTITLKWIVSHSRRWKTFVANRVSAIQQLTPPESWRHVKSGDNPADLPSRGMCTSDLAESTLWWHGPSWLQSDQYPNSQEDKNDDDEMKKEERSKQLLSFHHANTDVSPIMQLIENCSSLLKLLHCAVHLTRFIRFLRLKKPNLKFEAIIPAEKEAVKGHLIVFVQREVFAEDYSSLECKKKVASTSKLLSLDPFLDSDGVLRVGGRIDNAGVSYDSRHPIILPHNHHLTHLIIRDAHIHNLHGTFTLTFADLRRKYWILRGRDTVRHFIRKCIICRRARAAATQQLMGNLPTARVTPRRPFLHVGVDFAGPFQTKLKKGRHFAIVKSYFCVFVCLSTKAVHLEAVTSLSTDDFIACYERFVSRRGVAAHIYSDCGTNFVGADRVLQEFLQEESSRVQQQCANRGTTWHFNPPSAPHQGGLWEACVKQVKHHLLRVVGQRVLLLEQFQTLLCRIEACLNSRPLCALSSDPNDLEALTPGHFLIGEPLTSIPEPDVTLVNENRLKQWEVVRQMTQNFWQRWTYEYLGSLQQRFKWKQRRDNVQVGDLVVVANDLLPVAKWKLGRVTKTHPGTDGLVRSATVRTAGGELKRPITKLTPLISIDEQ